MTIALPGRTFLVHLNLILPDDAPPADNRSYALALLREIEAVLAGAADAEFTPQLASCSAIVVVDGEEI